MRQILAITLLTLLSCLVFLSYTSTQMQDERNALLARQNQILETSYKAVTQMYKVSIESYFKYIVLQQDVLDILHDAKEANAEDKAILRGLLYRVLYPIYNNDLKNLGVRQLHFHTPKGESFLRFHKPSENGDPLFDIRPSIKIANTDKVFVSGFEGGRIYPGFRYVFPIIDKGEHLGSVEISLPYEESIELELSKLVTCKNHILLMKKSVTTNLVFDIHKEHFMPSSFSNEFVIENQKISSISQKSITSPIVDTINTRIKQKYPIEKLLLDGKNFSTPIIDGEEGYIANFHAIYDTSDALAAYAVTYGEMNELVALEKKYLITNFMGCFILFLLGFGIYLYLKQYQKMRSEKIQFETIVRTTVNGILLLHTDGTIRFMNLAACKILGYKEGEVEGENSHELIHVHNTDHDKEHCRILSSIKSQKAYVGEELFRKKNGDKITVLVNANSFIQDDKSIGSVTIFRDITQEKKNQARIEHLAYYDALTDLPNRKLLLNRLSLALKESTRSFEFGGLLFIDLDNFKTLNDTYGHDMGDKLLQEVALRLQSQLRTCDTVARFGGDEFVILITKLGNDEAKAKDELYKIGQKLLQAIVIPYHFVTVDYGFTASIGGTLFLDDTKTVDDILKNADAAMYEVKKEGKNEIKIL